METESIFEYNPESGEIEYSETDVVENVESEDVSNESGDLSSETGTEGPLLSGEEETEEVETSVDVSSDSGFDSDLLLSEPVLSALYASTPASGSLSSSTIDYFDRLVSGLDSDYVYVAYRNDSDDSYAGTIVYGDDYEISGNSIVFGEGSVAVDVSRYSGSGFNNYITYNSSDASDSVISVSDSGTILYYTNAFEGYPVLGGYQSPVQFGQVIVVGLLSVFVSVVLNKLFNRNRG